MNSVKRIFALLAVSLLMVSCGSTDVSSSSNFPSSSDPSVPSSSSSSTSSGIDPKHLIENGSFEAGDLSGWDIVSGTAFSDSGISSSDVGDNGELNKDGLYFYEKTDETAEGVLRSSPFVLGGSGFITFRLAGGYNVGLTYCSVLRSRDSFELARYGNSLFSDPELGGSETRIRDFGLYKADLRKYLGESLVFSIVDRSTSNYGYLSVDGVFGFHETEPDSAYTLATNIRPEFGVSSGNPYSVENGSFSNGTIDGWKVIGETGVFQDSQVSSGKLSNRPDESKIGVLRSSSFKIGGTGLISFRLGGTKHRDLTYMSVLRVGTNYELFRTWSNRWKEKDEENTHLYYIDLSDAMGESVYLEFIDNSRSDWGLLVISDIITYHPDDERVLDESAVNILEPLLVNPSYSNMRSRADSLFSSSSEAMSSTLKTCFLATLDGATNSKGKFDSPLEYHDDGRVFVLTGDISAMWLRDSSVQVLPYLHFVNVDPDVKALFKALIRRQMEFIRRDPYANAFNQDGSVFERKFEIDSLIYPLWLMDLYHEATGDDSLYDYFFSQAFSIILKTLVDETDHSDSRYAITNQSDLNASSPSFNSGSGLIWSGYRPSDDVTYYKFNIPENMFACAALEKTSSALDSIGKCQELSDTAKSLASSVRGAIEKYGIYNSSEYGRIYAYETNGFEASSQSSSGKLLMDAANVPSLIAAPWLGYCAYDDQTYLNTRDFVLSKDNPYYYEGTYAKGIGDPHDMVPEPSIWPLSLAMQALTSLDDEEVGQCLEYMLALSNGMGVMHEAVNANDPSVYSRDFFTWPCALFAEAYLVKVKHISII